MPKIHNPEQAEQKRQQILNAAKRCFIQHGFHQTSMRQIIEAAELSAGGVYHYFPAKEAIVAAIAETERYQLNELIAHFARLPDARKAVFGMVDTILQATPTDEAILATEIFAESCRNEAVKTTTLQNVNALEAALLARLQACEATLVLPEKTLANLIIVLCEGLIGRIATRNLSVKTARQLAKQTLMTWL